MATESCPRCGEKAISQTGHCVFCGAVVIAATIKPAGKEYNKVLRGYCLVSSCFVVLGIVYVALGIIGSVMLKSPMLGLIVAGSVTFAHGTLLILNNDWIRSITKVVCYVRLALFAFTTAILAPYMLHLGMVGLAFFCVFTVDILCLILMIRAIDDVYFA